ncbi:uncharacterized protein V1518DRAFT_424304 [Limtongia smithiae]|uniref:uncharacterized protein n=1 Tax=Limtongia smithiae TaxID=1125753 RepID=UPI0034CD2EFA
MDDLLDLSFTPAVSPPSRGVAAAMVPAQLTPTATPSPAPSPAPSLLSNMSSSARLSSATPVSPRKQSSSSSSSQGVEPFASLVSFSSAKRTQANSLNAQLLRKQQERMPFPATSSANTSVSSSDWAAGLSFDFLETRGSAPTTPSPAPSANTLLDDDDILGPLAHAVAPTPPTPARQSASLPPGIVSTASSTSTSASSRRSTSYQSTTSAAPAPTPAPASAHIPDIRTAALAELVDMGFTRDKATRALELTDTGADVQQAIDILLMQAHDESRRQQGVPPRRNAEREDERLPSQPPRSQQQQQRQRRRPPRDNALPPHPDDLGNSEWQDMPTSYPRRRATGDVVNDEHSNGAANGSGSSGFMAQFSNQQELGKLASTLRSRAEGLWKQGKETVAKAVEEYQASGGISGTSGPAPVDDGAPRWMRGQQLREQHHLHHHGHPLSSQQPQLRRHTPGVDVASPVPESKSRGQVAATLEAMMLEQEAPSGSPSPPAMPQRPSTRTTASQSRQQPRQQAPPQRSAVSAKFVDDDMPQYLSRRRQAPTPSTRASPAAATASSLTASRPVTVPKPEPKPKPNPSPRMQPTLSTMQLDEITLARTEGTDAFKRGDFTASSESYTQALDLTPANHLLRAILLANRAACLLKLGDIRNALRDAEEGLALIGAGRGVDEEIEPGKALNEIWGRLLQRKAEALEQLEKFKEARDAWNELVEAGKGGKAAMDGRRRCDKVISPPSSVKTTPASSARNTPAPTPSTRSSSSAASTPRPPPSTTPLPTGDALKRLQQSDSVAEAAEAEKFALHDVVEAKLIAWRGGKEDNLRALLASMDAVLWPESGWVKVSMAELVMPRKVKIVYMRAVAKTHPDKIAQGASTEQKMIAEGVFVSLNRAWDEFKKQNNIQ